MTIKKILVIPLALAFVAFGTLGTVSAQTASPRVSVELLNSGLTSPLTASSNNARVARLVLDTTGSSEAVRISSLPFILSTGNGATASNLRNCRVYNETNMSNSLSSGLVLASGLNNVNLGSSMTLAAGTVTTLALVCDIDSDLAANGTFTFSMNTANVAATGVSTGLPALVSVRGSVYVPPVVTPPYVPGLPTTGAGGEAPLNIAFILGSVVVAGLGLALMRKEEVKRA